MYCTHEESKSLRSVLKEGGIMARELINAKITPVSYVYKAANQKQLFFTKSADQTEPMFQKEVKVFINKEEAAQQLVDEPRKNPAVAL